MNKKSITITIFVLSLMVNAFLGGYLLSTTVRGNLFISTPPPPPPHSPFERMNNAISKIDIKYKEQIEKIINNKQESINSHMEFMHQNINKIKSVLTAENFDMDSLNKIKADMDKKDNAVKEDIFAMAVSIAEILPKEERILFFNILFSEDVSFVSKPHHPPPSPLF